MKSFLKIPILTAAAFVFTFACFIEILQAIDFVNLIGMENNKVASVVLGNHFDWGDICFTY